MLQRQKLWRPAALHNPAFAEYFHRFITDNPVTSMNVAALNIRPENFFVALQPDARDPRRQVAAMLATQIKVLGPVCNDGSFTGPHYTSSSSSAAALPRQMSFGFATALCDSMNSFHVMLRMIPVYVPHVSVNIQIQLCEQSAEQLTEGADVVVVSSIDKMGKRLVYCTTSFYAEPKHMEAEVVDREAAITTLSDLQLALRRYETLIHSTHVKSILLKDTKK